MTLHHQPPRWQRQVGAATRYVTTNQEGLAYLRCSQARKAQVCRNPQRSRLDRKKRFGRVGASALSGGTGNETAARTKNTGSPDATFTHSKSTSITGFTEVGVHPERERGHQDGIHACNPSKRCPFIDIRREKKKGIEEQWINLTIVGKRTNMVGERTNLRNQL